MARPEYKDRQITIYLPSAEVLRDWEKRAAAGHISLNKFIFERVESTFDQETETKLLEDQRARETEDLRTRLKKTREEAKEIEDLLYEAELAEREELMEVRFNVVQTLKSGGIWTAHKIAKDIKTENPVNLKLIVRVMSELESARLIEEQETGFKWIG